MKNNYKFFMLFLLLYIFMSHCITLSAPQISEGDTLQFWSVSYIDWQPNPPVNQRLITAVCKKAGTSCYVFTDVNLAVTPSQQTINTMSAIFDTSYSVRLPQKYGPVPDVFDNDPRVFILIVEPEGWTGYFDPAHQMPDTMVYRIWQKHSTQREVIFLSSSAFTGTQHLSTLAHEFGHLLHWGSDHSPEPPQNPVKYWEDTWIDEAFATFAAVYLTENLSAQNIYDPSAFFSFNPDLSLIYFEGGMNYNQVKLWLVYMYEHFGGFNFISALIGNQLNGLQGVASALNSLGYNIPFETTFEQWITANYLDNIQYQNGKYGYYHYNFPPPLISATYSSYPVTQHTASVSSYAADYILFTSNTPRQITVSITRNSAYKFRLSLILMNVYNQPPVDVINIPLDTGSSANYYASGFGSEYKQILLQIMCTDTALQNNSSAQYTYSALSSYGITPINGSIPNEYKLYNNYPNPFNPTTKIKFDLPKSTDVKISVFDVTGKEVSVLVNEKLQAGTYQTEWDASAYPSGVYFYKIQVHHGGSSTGDFNETKRMMLVK